MTKLRDVYRCSICGNVIEIVHEGAPALVCCGKPMEKLEAKNQDTGHEKHVPQVTETEKGILVQVGSIEHPMEEKHYIKFIEVLTQDKVLRGELSPGQKPAFEFPIDKSQVVEIREFCTIHGLWKNDAI